MSAALRVPGSEGDRVMPADTVRRLAPSCGDAATLAAAGFAVVCDRFRKGVRFLTEREPLLELRDVFLKRPDS